MSAQKKRIEGILTAALQRTPSICVPFIQFFDPDWRPGQEKDTTLKEIYGKDIPERFDFTREDIWKTLEEEPHDHPYCIPLTRYKRWNYSIEPHGLLAGRSGSGKSFVLFYLILALIVQGVKVYVADPKNSLTGLLDVRGNHVSKRCDAGTIIPGVCMASTEEGIMNMLRDFTKNMQDREQSGVLNTGQSPYEIEGMSIHTFIFDELGAFSSSLDITTKEGKAKKAELTRLVKQITLKGRGLGFQLITALQQANAENIPTEIRSQLSMRLSLGAPTLDEWKMLYGSAVRPDNMTDGVKGHGHLSVGGQEVVEVDMPLLPEDLKVLVKEYNTRYGGVSGYSYDDV